MKLCSIWLGRASAIAFALASAPAQQPPTFSAGNRTVAVYATVTDAHGRLVPDLTRDTSQSTTTASARS